MPFKIYYIFFAFFLQVIECRVRRVFIGTITYSENFGFFFYSFQKMYQDQATLSQEKVAQCLHWLMCESLNACICCRGSSLNACVGSSESLIACVGSSESLNSCIGSRDSFNACIGSCVSR